MKIKKTLLKPFRYWRKINKDISDSEGIGISYLTTTSLVLSLALIYKEGIGSILVIGIIGFGLGFGLIYKNSIFKNININKV